jgi:hypothetical protein
MSFGLLEYGTGNEAQYAPPDVGEVDQFYRWVNEGSFDAEGNYSHRAVQPAGAAVAPSGSGNTTVNGGQEPAEQPEASSSKLWGALIAVALVLLVKWND